jgi:glycosyltransferase involved in cell wall biosynthesis
MSRPEAGEQATILLMVANDRASFVSRRIEIAIAAQELGFDVHVALPPAAATTEDHFTDLEADECEKRLHASGVRVHDIPLARRGANMIYELRCLGSMFDLYASLKPDIVHHFTVKPILYGSFVASLTRVPVVINSWVGLGFLFGGEESGWFSTRRLVTRFYGLLAKRPAMISVFQNPDNLDVLVTEALIPRERTRLIRGSGVDVELFSPQSSERLPDTPLIVLVARLLWDKGIGEFVEAATSLRAEGVHARFALVGGLDPVNPRSISRGQVRAWEASGVIEWWGQRSDMHEVYSSASIVCLPSYAEGVPRSLLEAAAMARAIVASDVPGCREIVLPGITGLLVPPRDGRALAGALSSLIADPVLCKQLGAAGRELVTREFSLQQVVAATMVLYGENRNSATASSHLASPGARHV